MPIRQVIPNNVAASGDHWLLRRVILVAEDIADLAGQIELSIGFSQQDHPRIEPALMHDAILAVARGIERLDGGPAPGDLTAKLCAVDSAGHDDVGEDQLDPVPVFPHTRKASIPLTASRIW